jgi:putative endopeptidase
MNEKTIEQCYTPQNDFYNYVNHKWLSDKKNTIPDDYSSWGGFTKLHDDGLKKQINIIKELESNINLSEEEKKIYAIWKASENRFDLWNEDKSDYNPIENEINYLHNNLNSVYENQTEYINDLSNYFHYTQINSIQNVLDFDTGSDLTQTNNVVLDLSSCGLSLPSRVYYFKDEFKGKMIKFKTHLESINNIINNNTNITLTTNFVEDVIDFETKIANYTMTPDQSRNYDKYYTNTNLNELYSNINQLNSLDEKNNNYPEDNRNFNLEGNILKDLPVFFEKIYELFDFRKILENNLNKNFDTNDEQKPGTYHITTYDGDAIRRCLSIILDSNNLEKYKSFLSYKIIRKFGGLCSKELDDEFFNFYQKELGGQNKQKDREKRSIGLVNSLAGEMLGKIYVSKYFSGESKNNLKILINCELGIMKKSLANNDWLTNETKEIALIKLATFKNKIGYPDKWKDYSKLDINDNDSLYTIFKKTNVWSLHVNFFDKMNSKVDKSEWHMTPQTVNAYYSPNLNEIVFPAAILQPPFFHTSIDTIDFDYTDEANHLDNIDKCHINNDDLILATNLGGIGAVIAHEVTHGFDDQGRKFDENGNLNNWWNSEDIELFNNKCNQLKNIVNGYIYSDKTENKHTINGELTMGENLADIGGLSIALQTLKEHLNKKKSTKQYTKNILRVFFKAWANIWKLNIKEDNKIMLLNCDPHSPCDFRGNLVKNFDDFYEVYDIKENDKMYIKKNNRLIMW